MSNWLGFSLTSNPLPSLVLQDDEDHLQPLHGAGPTTSCFAPPPPPPSSAMPGSISALNQALHLTPFSRQEWRDDDEDNEHPKLEDFLGCCYSSSDLDEEDKMVNLNANVLPPSNDSLQLQTCPYLPPPQDTHLATGTGGGGGGSTGGGGGGCYSPFDGAPLSEFKSWLRQNPTTMVGPTPSSPSGGCGPQFQAVCFGMGHNVGPVDGHGKKRSQPKSIIASNGGGSGKDSVPRKSVDTFGQRTSQYRGVTRHRWTGRYEAHLWDNSCRKEGQTRKGRQVYLGGYEKEEKAARAYDLAALKYWGPTTHINFPLSSYAKELEEMKNMSRQEFVAHLRRQSSGFSRGASIYRGVTRHHQHGRWQARIGRIAGNKDLYLGTFSTQEEAAEAYDIAAIKFRGTSAVTNFNISRYDVKRICSTSTLIGGDLAKRSTPNNDSLVENGSSQSALVITNNGMTHQTSSYDLANMTWNVNGNYNDKDHGVKPKNTMLMDSSSDPTSPKGFVGPVQDLTVGENYSPIAYLSPQNLENENCGSCDELKSIGFVSQVPIFALWNE